MTTKNNNSINANISGERNNINIHVPSPDKKESSNWLLKAIVGGIITVLASLCIYYIQNATGGKASRNPESLPKVNQIEGVKQ